MFCWSKFKYGRDALKYAFAIKSSTEIDLLDGSDEEQEVL